MGKRLIGSVGLKPGTDTGFDLDQKGQIHGYTTTQYALDVGTNNFIIYADSTTASGLAYGASAKSLFTAEGDILYASGANALAKLAKGSDGDVLTLASGVPSWASGGGATTTITDDYMSGGSQSTTSTTAVAVNLTGTTLQASGKALGVLTVSWYSSNVGGDAITIYLVDGSTNLPACVVETRDQNTPQSCSRAYTADCGSQAITAEYYGQAGVLLYINGRAIGHASSADGNMTSLHTLEVA